MVAAESVLLWTLGIKGEYGLYSCVSYSRADSDTVEICSYGGTVLAAGSHDRCDAIESANAAATARGATMLLVLDTREANGRVWRWPDDTVVRERWILVDGATACAPRFAPMQLANDARGTGLVQNCWTDASGTFRPRRDIAAMSPTLVDMLTAEFRWSYQLSFWGPMDRARRAQLGEPRCPAGHLLTRVVTVGKPADALQCESCGRAQVSSQGVIAELWRCARSSTRGLREAARGNVVFFT